MRKHRPEQGDSVRLRAREEELAQLRQDFVRLQGSLAEILEKVRRPGNQGPFLMGDIALAPAAPPAGLHRRVLGGLRRIAARAVRGVIGLVHPCNERIRALEFCAETGETTLPAGADLHCTGPALPQALLEDLRWLFALESIDAVSVGESLLQPAGKTPEITMPLGPALLQRAEEAGRPLIIRRLDVPAEDSPAPLMLRPEGLGKSPALFCSGAYTVAMPASTRRAELLLGTQGVEILSARREFSWALLLGSELVCGLENRVFSALPALGPGLVLSLADTSELGRRRLRDLERLGCETHDFGRLLHQTTRPAAVGAAIRLSGAHSLWAIGGEGLEASLTVVREKSPSLRIFRENPGRGLTLDEAEAQFFLRPGQGAGLVLPTPLPVPERVGRRAEEGECLRKRLGLSGDTRLVVIAEDLVPEARPEDAVLLADELRRMGDESHLCCTGEGPLAGRMADLRRLFGLDRFHLLPSGDVRSPRDAVDLCCVLGESPYLPPGAAAALMAGIPVLSVRGNELENFRDAGSIFFADRPGDIEAMAGVIHEFPRGGKSQASFRPAQDGDFAEKLRRLLLG